MATMNNKTDAKVRKSQQDDAVPYKVMIALALLCGALFGLDALKNFFTTVEGINALFDYTWIIALSGLSVMIVFGVMLAVFRKCRVIRIFFPWLIAAGMLIALTGAAMKVSWIEDFDLLIFICVAALVQYVVFQLYKWEFFLVSMPTVSSAAVFYGLKSGFTFDVRCLFLLIVVLLLSVASVLCARFAAKNKGKLVIGSWTRTVFSPKSSPMLVYLVSAFWLCCLTAVIVLSLVTGIGGLFSYYCMFAAIAVEFIAAVYYTFQLN